MSYNFAPKLILFESRGNLIPCRNLSWKCKRNCTVVLDSIQQLGGKPREKQEGYVTLGLSRIFTGLMSSSCLVKQNVSGHFPDIKAYRFYLHVNLVFFRFSQTVNFRASRKSKDIAILIFFFVYLADFPFCTLKS